MAKQYPSPGPSLGRKIVKKPTSKGTGKGARVTKGLMGQGKKYGTKG